MEHQLKALQKRDVLVDEVVTETLTAALDDLLPRIHLYLLEHGNPVHLQANLTLAVEKDTIRSHVSMEICQPPPRATATAELSTKSLNEEDAP